jgi:hypothetical protein
MKTACNVYGEGEMLTEFEMKNMKMIDHPEDLSVAGRIIFK